LSFSFVEQDDPLKLSGKTRQLGLIVSIPFWQLI